MRIASSLYLKESTIAARTRETESRERDRQCDLQHGGRLCDPNLPRRACRVVPQRADFAAEFDHVVLEPVGFE